MSSARLGITKELVEKPLSFSQITAYQTCRYRWYLQYVLGLRAKLRTAPLEIGDAVHRALAEFLAGGDYEDGITRWYDDAVAANPLDDAELEDKIREYRHSALIIVERALDGLRELGFWTYIDPKTGQPSVERDLFVPLPTWAGGMIARLDWIAYDPVNHRIWVVDFKTRGYFTTDEDEWANLQNVIYTAAALYNDIETVGTLTFQITNTAPRLPKRTKDGGMSRAAVACDWQTYERCLVEAGLNPDDYEDMKAKLDGRELVRVTPVLRAVKTVENVWNQIVEPLAQHMRTDYALALANPAKVPEILPRNLSPRTCNYCAVRPICHGQLKGYGVRSELANFEYKPLALDVIVE